MTLIAPAWLLHYEFHMPEARAVYPGVAHSWQGRAERTERDGCGPGAEHGPGAEPGPAAEPGSATSPGHSTGGSFARVTIDRGCERGPPTACWSRPRGSETRISQWLRKERAPLEKALKSRLVMPRRDPPARVCHHGSTQVLTHYSMRYGRISSK